MRRTVGLVTGVFACAVVEAGAQSVDRPGAVVRVNQERTGSLVQHVIQVTNTSKSMELVSVIVGLRPDLTPGLRETPFRISLPAGWREESPAPQGQRKSPYQLTFTCSPGGSPAPGQASARCMTPGASQTFRVLLRTASASLSAGPVVAVLSDGSQVVAERR